MQQFSVAIVTRPTIKTAGLAVRTTMQLAAVDCPHLWEKEFGPRMMDFPVNPELPGQSYGVSVMVDEVTFDYWAVMPIAPGATVPEDMDVLTLAGGLYAECHINSLEQLKDAYAYIYMDWPTTQARYALDMTGASYELYTADWLTSGKLTVYCPLLEK